MGCGNHEREPYLDILSLSSSEMCLFFLKILLFNLWCSDKHRCDKVLQATAEHYDYRVLASRHFSFLIKKSFLFLPAVFGVLMEFTIPVPWWSPETAVWNSPALPKNSYISLPNNKMCLRCNSVTLFCGVGLSPIPVQICLRVQKTDFLLNAMQITPTF